MHNLRLGLATNSLTELDRRLSNRGLGSDDLGLANELLLGRLLLVEDGLLGRSVDVASDGLLRELGLKSLLRRLGE